MELTSGVDADDADDEDSVRVDADTDDADDADNLDLTSGCEQAPVCKKVFKKVKNKGGVKLGGKD